MARKKAPQEIAAGVLVSSRRRCCLCFGLQRDLRQKPGQLAHLDHNSENSNEENLAFLCLEHHDQYDSKTSQSKNYTIKEVKQYRAELYDAILQPAKNPPPEPTASPVHVRERFTTHTEQGSMSAIVEFMTDKGRPQSNLADLARQLSLRTETVARLLFLLSEDGIVRIDRKTGNTSKTYSLASSLENRLIDAFVASLDIEVEFDRRYLRKKQHEVDAHVGTSSATYAVETMFCNTNLSTNRATKKIDALDDAKKAFGLDDLISVLVVGITPSTTQSDFDLKTIEDRGVLVRFVELE